MLTALLSVLAPNSNARPVEIYGNANGLWSPTHPHVTRGNSKAPEWTPAYTNSPVLYEPPPVEEVAETPTFDVCPTLQSAPHLCQDA